MFEAGQTITSIKSMNANSLVYVRVKTGKSK